jgi:hypothetical protein
MKNLLLTAFVVTFLFASFTHAQVNSDALTNKKEIAAQRTYHDIKINGELDEFDWSSAEIATDLIQLDPSPGEKASNKTEIKVIYDNQAIYISAKMYTDPTKISKQLTERDALDNCDWFGILLSPYQDGINALEFIISSAGVQFDAKLSTFGEDEAWDAVWRGETKITADGWIVEVEIPYSAIRFPDKTEQVWDINFFRFTNSTQEKSFWSEIKPTVNGLVNQSGTLTGISEIKSPIRLQATPFLATYIENYNDKAEINPQAGWGKSFNAGMDIKYGLSDAFTLDMTLIPDFGEAVSDNQVLNLTQFEVRFNENRQFFTEGTELFNKGGLFYSRRIGGSPMHSAADFLQDGEEVEKEPGETQLYNATKISGRTTKGTGIGFFNAVSGATNATLRAEDESERQVETNPLTNYNVIVIDQNLKNNSFITLINTNVERNGSDYDANATGLIFNLRNKKESYRIRGNVKVSQQFFSNNDAYTSHVNNLFITAEDLADLTENPDKKILFGHAYNVGVSKINGNFNFGTGYGIESHTYDINDLGFLYNNNEQNVDLWFKYSHYKPFGKFNSMGGGLWSGMDRLYSPNKFTELGINAYWWMQTKGFWKINFFGYAEPFKNGQDFFEPRTPGRFVKTPKMWNTGASIISDQRKKLVWHLNTNGGKTIDLYDANWWSLSTMGEWRATDRFNISLDIRNVFDFNDVGYVDDHGTNGEEIILGKRDQRTVINTLRAGYSFTKNMNLSFRLRHYWASVKYNSFHNISTNGELIDTDYHDFNDRSSNFFNIDMIYRWRFAPGSDIFFVWKNAISDISGQTDLIQYDYRKGTQRLGEFPQSNSFSLKVVYFLDYLSLTN